MIGSREAPSALSAGNKWLDAGPVAGRPTTEVDAAADTVTVAVNDSGTGAKATLTMSWPARPGSWNLDFTGPDPEQTVKMTRGARACTFTAGTLTVHRAEATSTGQVAALSIDLNGSCALSTSGEYVGAQVRIADADPTRVVSIPRATPASVSTGALNGTVVTHQFTLTNAGDKPWKIGTAATSSRNSWYPTFKVVPESNQCTGLTLATGQSCTLQVTTTATSYTVYEYLLVGGDSATTLVVPLTLEGYAPVEPPTGATAATGRLSATLAWQPPTTLPRREYRIYDVTGGARTLLATAPTTATELNVPGAGGRRLAVVAANGRFAESHDAVVDVPAIASELVGNDPWGKALSVATDATGLRARQLTLEKVDLDPSRTRWVTPSYSDISVCPVATEKCTTVPDTASTADADTPREAIWLPNGSIAFVRGYSSELRTLWAVWPDGSGLRKVASIPERWQLTAAPSGTEVVVKNANANTLERVRLSDGRITAVPGTSWVDGFTVSNRGLLVIERRVDTTATDGPRTTTVMNLDGSSARRLAMPAGDNRAVAYDPSGTRVAFARYVDGWDATMWVAAADGTGARQLSTASKGWTDLKWSVNDRMAPTASVTVPAYTTRTATITIGAADGDDAAGSLRRQCRLDQETTWSTCGATLTLTGLAAGTHTIAVQVTDPSGKQSPVVSKNWTVDPTLGTVERWAGADRFASSAAFSAKSYPAGVNVAYVASGLNFPDALSGAPIAGKSGGPVLLTATNSLPAPIAMELKRLRPKRIVILGGAGAVSNTVKTKLAGYTSGGVERWAGADRFASSAAFSAKSYPAGVNVAYVASGLNFPDALSGAPIAGKSGGPVLLTATNSLPAPIAMELKRLRPKRIVILGGAGAVSNTVKTKLAGYTSGGVERWAGADRFASSAAFSAKSYPAGVNVAYVASGLNFPDALSGAPIAGKSGGPVLLTATNSLPAPIAMELKRLRPKKIVVLGGAGAVSGAVATELKKYLG